MPIIMLTKRGLRLTEGREKMNLNGIPNRIQQEDSFYQQIGLEVKKPVQSYI
jgi:hypothetical protein